MGYSGQRQAVETPRPGNAQAVKESDGGSVVL